MQYIGQTVNSLNTRLKGHRSGLNTGNEPKFVREHFTKIHNPSNLTIRPICSVPSVSCDKDTDNSVRKNLTKSLKSLEDQYILKLNTLFPYGLNDRLEKPLYIDSEVEFLKGACIYKLFPVIVSSRSSRGSRAAKSSPKPTVSFDPSSVMSRILTLYDSGNLHACRTLICSLKYSNVIELGGYAKECVNTVSISTRRCYLIVIDLCNHFRSRSVSYINFRSNKYKVNGSKSNNRYSEFVPIKFISKEIEGFNINNILNSRTAMNLFPSKNLSKKFCHSDFRFSTCYKYENSIRSDIINYKENIMDFGDIADVKCYCHLYPEHVDQSVGHVVTGDLDIVKNRKLKKLFKKGYKFIEPLYKNKHSIFNSIKKDLVSYIKSLSEKFSVSVEYFDGWLVTVLHDIKNEVFCSKISCKRSQSVFVSESNDVDTLKDHFVITGIDKAQNNLSFICRYYYLKNLEEELSTTKTYIPSDKSEDEIVKEHALFCKKYNIPVSDFTVPFMHMIPKFHKPQLDFRYIAAGTKCSTKPLAKILSGVFKLIDKTLKYSDNFKFKFKNTSGYWIVKNKDEQVSVLDFLNNSSSAKSVNSFDFKKLYTNIPHDKVIGKLSDLIKRCFDDKKVKYINVSKNFKASWSDKTRLNWSLSFDDIIELFKYLIDNIYVKFRGSIFKQIVGIPMGCDCAPQVADLFLYWYEHDYISKGVLVDDPAIHLLKHASRYIDDLNVPNIDSNICESICYDIYPEELDIVPTNTSFSNTTFLDLDISVIDGKFISKLYDKRRDFGFKVITFPNLRSNIPNKTSYGTFIGELYRTCKSSTRYEDFIHDVKLLINKLINQKFEKSLLYSCLNRFLRSKPACISKYWHCFNVSEFM